MGAALELWHAPKSAEQIATHILRLSCNGVNDPLSEAGTAMLARAQAGPKHLPAG
jgi:hypothetical protein